METIRLEQKRIVEQDNGTLNHNLRMIADNEMKSKIKQSKVDGKDLCTPTEITLFNVGPN